MPRTTPLFLLLPFIGSCADAMRGAEAPPAEQKTAPSAAAPGGGEGARDEGRAGGRAAPKPSFAAAKGDVAANEELDAAEPAAPPPAEDGEAGGPALRAWFPESFLWMPYVETDTSGRATVPVTAPDTLTTWRVLALAQSERGGQGGALTTFRTTLPAYVDLVTPSFLVQGDEVALPVQVVNQLGEGLAAPLDVDVLGGSGGAGGRIAVAPWGTAERAVTVSADRAGELVVRATLGELDAVERRVTVRPEGRPVDQVRGGSLAAPRTLSVDTLPGGRSPELLLTVFPGARSLVATEVALAEDRGSDVGSAAYAWALSQRARALAPAAPAEGDPGPLGADALRTVELHALQRLSRANRVPDTSAGALALAGFQVGTGMAAVPEAGAGGAGTTAAGGAARPAGAAASPPFPETLAGGLAARLAGELEDAQQPDGLWAVAPGAPLDRSLLHTARVLWALGPEAEGPRVRAGGAFERFRQRLSTPALAAWALASGAAGEDRTDALKKTVTDAIVVAPDGSKSLPGGGGATTAEATAVAILALLPEGADVPDADRALAADLAAGLITRWSESSGFGGGWANLLALRALDRALGGEVPGSVEVELLVDGQPAGRARLDPQAPWDPIRLRAPGPTSLGAHSVEVRATPAVPGLSFVLNARAWLPWEQVPSSGLDVVVSAERLVVGQATQVRVRAAGPSGERVDLDVGLPAGVAVDRDELASALTAHTVESWLAEDGRVHLSGLLLPNGSVELALPVTPTLPGRLSTGPSRISPADQPEAAFVRVPAVWGVGGG